MPYVSNSAATSSTTAAATSGSLWNLWCRDYVSTTGGDQLVWRLWSSNSAAATTTYVTTSTLDVTWTTWQVEQSLRYPPAPVVSTAEQIAAREAARIEQQQRNEAAAAARRIAIAKADQLLESVLDEVQRQHFKATDSFLVVGRSGKLYRIRRGRSGNVDEVEPNGRVVQRYCAHPVEFVPDGDTMVAQKLMLECDEDAFLRMANRHGAMGSPVPAAMIDAMLARAPRGLVAQA